MDVNIGWIMDGNLLCGSVSIIYISILCFAASGEESARRRKKKANDKSNNHTTIKTHRKTSPNSIHLSTSQTSIKPKSPTPSINSHRTKTILASNSQTPK